MCGGVAATPRRAKPSNSSSDTAGAADFMVGLELWVEKPLARDLYLYLIPSRRFLFVFLSATIRLRRGIGNLL